MRYLIALMMATPLAALPQQAVEPPPAILRMKPCAPPDCVLANYTELLAAIQRSNENYQRALDAEAALAEERKAKGCAKVEVTEPSKAPRLPLINDGSRKAS